MTSAARWAEPDVSAAFGGAKIGFGLLLLLRPGERMVRLDLSGRDVIEVLEQDQGLRVSQARMEISAVAMPRLAAKWLQATTDGPAWQVHRVLLDDEGKPLQLETARHQADRFSYQLTMSR